MVSQLLRRTSLMPPSAGLTAGAPAATPRSRPAPCRRRRPRSGAWPGSGGGGSGGRRQGRTAFALRLQVTVVQAGGGPGPLVGLGDRLAGQQGVGGAEIVVAQRRAQREEVDRP